MCRTDFQISEQAFVPYTSHGAQDSFYPEPCIAFPIQVLGFDVDLINSEQFLNHTSYKCFKGQVITEQEPSELLLGLRMNNIDTYTHLLTGYIGSPEVLKQIVELHRQLKMVNPDLIYVCHPVMGGYGRLCVPEEIIPIYRESILSIATILSPNLFEMELLTNIKMRNEDNIWEAIDVLHNKGVETVCVTSAILPGYSGKLFVIVSSRKGNPMKLKLGVPNIPASFTGSGDVFTALLLSYMQLTNSDLKESLEKTMAALHAVLKRTFDYASGKEVDPRNVELRLIQSRDDILNPPVEYKATVVE